MKRKVDREKILALWESDLRNDELAEALGVTRGGLVRLRQRLKLPVRGEKADRLPKPDPTPEEIEQRSAEVRAGWSKLQEQSRWVMGDIRVRAPRYEYDGRNATFSAMDT